MTLTPENKKWMWIVGILAIIILVVAGSDYWQSTAEARAHPCAINFLDTFLYNVSATTTKESIAHTLLTQYLNAYKHVPFCPQEGVKDYKITSIGVATDIQSANEFTIPVTFDLLPASKTNTVWATTTSNWDGDWLRGHEANLGIQHIQLTPGAATSTYRLVI